MFQKGQEFITFVRLESSAVEASINNQFTAGDQATADSLRVN